MFSQLNVATAAVVALALLLSGGYLGYRFEAGKVAELQLQYAQAEIKARGEAAALQKAEDDVNTAVAVSEAQTQAAMATQAAQTLQEVTTYVPIQTVALGSRVGCVPYGFIRLLDAASSGRGPSALQLPAGSSNDTCSPVDPVTLARGIVANYAAARANAEQLNTLELNIRELAKSRGQ